MGTLGLENKTWEVTGKGALTWKRESSGVTSQKKSPWPWAIELEPNWRLHSGLSFKIVQV